MSPDGGALYLAAERSRQILRIDAAGGKLVGVFDLRGSPTGVAVAEDGGKLVVTFGEETNAVAILDPRSGRVLSRMPAGHGACGPAAITGRRAAVVCNRYDNTVSRIDYASGRESASGRVEREPVAAAFSADGGTLAVANLLPAGPANTLTVGAAVSLLDARSLKCRAQVRLPAGSTSVRGLAFHPSKDLCAVVHNLARFQVPATQVEYGWMNAAALSLISAGRAELLATIVLDEPRRGAANPWAVAWTSNGDRLCVTHAGTHELSVIEFPALARKVSGLRSGCVVTDFGFLDGLRTRIPLPGNGPRAVVADRGVAYVAEFFSDSVCAVDLSSKSVRWTLALGQPRSNDRLREGERLFNDASICHQGWQSCASCHPDGRADGLNWDLLNDGIGNPKNTRSLVLAFETPPAMSSGVRSNAQDAVYSGLRHILFAPRSEAVAGPIADYLRSLRPVPSPLLKSGALSRQAQRGKRLFEDPRVGCAVCHPAPYYTDLKPHGFGADDARELPGRPRYAPSLVECWRTAPYLHDGSAATMQEVLRERNPGDRHGNTSHLSKRQLEDLAAYVLSL